ncbi:MAG: HEAT repeat domain-containing protein [Fulvivirga sp.]|uniref:HEAT repeat domain-containing protein n=1 Tax=Fulvivirga sp. TaxID=1931237 RepID=UPI0032EE5DB5
MPIDEQSLLTIIKGGEDENAYEASDILGKNGSKESQKELIGLLTHDNDDVKFLAARTLGLMTDNSLALEPLLAAIQDKANAHIAGDLLMALEGFDVSEHYVPIFKLYLFGSFKVSRIAKEILDYKEFNISPRVLKKAKKHWNHYTNNVKHDDSYLLVKREVEEMFVDIEIFIEHMGDS